MKHRNQKGQEELTNSMLAREMYGWAASFETQIARTPLDTSLSSANNFL